MYSSKSIAYGNAAGDENEQLCNTIDLANAKFSSLSRNIPIVYFILATNTLVVAYEFWNSAPTLLVRHCPIMLAIFCFWRTLVWVRSARSPKSTDQARKGVRFVNLVVPAMTIVYCQWVFALFPYGDVSQQGFLAFYIAMTIVGCILCLTPSLPAALGATVVGNVSLFLHFGFSGNSTFIAMGINVALASLGLVTTTRNYNRDFARMVAAHTKAQALSEETIRLANVDELTDLPNRRHFFGRLSREFARASAEEDRLTLGVIDLDGFKPVNDLHGHPVGDKLLSEVASRLRLLDADGTLEFSRLGGDEFAFLIVNDAAPERVLQVAEKICETLSVPFTIGNIEAQIQASIGLAMYPEAANDRNTLFARADYALYAQKRAEKGGASLFTPEHEAEALRFGNIEKGLHAAEFADEFFVLFQPIVDASRGRTVAFEALARWTSPVLGPVAPAVFIPIAERMGIVGDLTRALLQKALDAAVTWPADIKLSFNLSAMDLGSPSTVLALVCLISKSGFDPKRLDFEITETAMILDFEKARVGIDLLKSLGCGISLDDFGTGFSSLSQLHSLPLTKIKVDRSFVAGLHENPTSYKIVKSLVALSRDMGIGCIIEGVETEAEWAALRTLGCDHLQGYHFSEPLTDEDALQSVIEGSDLAATYAASA